MTTIKRAQAKDFIRKTNGKIFTTTFVKKNGDLRVMNCRLGVTKHLRGGDSTTAHIDNLVTVFDVQKGEYRSINTNTLKQIKFAGDTVEIED